MADRAGTARLRSPPARCHGILWLLRAEPPTPRVRLRTPRGVTRDGSVMAAECTGAIELPSSTRGPAVVGTGTHAQSAGGCTPAYSLELVPPR